MGLLFSKKNSSSPRSLARNTEMENKSSDLHSTLPLLLLCVMPSSQDINPAFNPWAFGEGGLNLMKPRWVWWHELSSWFVWLLCHEFQVVPG